LNLGGVTKPMALAPEFRARTRRATFAVHGGLVIWINRRLGRSRRLVLESIFGVHMTTLDVRASLFDRIGGTNAVRGMVDRFYASVLADQELKPYFESVEMDKLRRMQFEFFSAALGGPIRYSGRTVIHAHQGRHIRREHFQAFVEHLFETLKHYSLDDADRYAIIARINTYADDVIGSGFGLDT
jgi:hemoglobin